LHSSDASPLLLGDAFLPGWPGFVLPFGLGESLCSSWASSSPSELRDLFFLDLSLSLFSILFLWLLLPQVVLSFSAAAAPGVAVASPNDGGGWLG